MEAIMDIGYHTKLRGLADWEVQLSATGNIMHKGKKAYKNKAERHKATTVTNTALWDLRERPRLHPAALLPCC